MAAVRFDLSDRIEMIKSYYSTGNASATARNFGQRSPQPSTVLRLVKKFEETGSVTDKQGRGRKALYKDEQFREAILTEFNPNIATSTRRIAKQLQRQDYNVSHTTVWKALTSIGYKPYIPHIALNDDDPDRRMEACELFQQMFNDDPAILDRILWSDEASFKLNGHINRHNCVYWNEENLHHTIQHDVNLPGVTVWCAISSLGIIGPYFFEGNVTGVSYLNMLKEFLQARLPHNDLILQQDGTTPHYARIVRAWLNETFPERWIGRRGPIEWPARSPDLTPADFFMWGFLKDKVYARNPRNIEELKTAITHSTREIDIELCQKVCRSVRHRVNLCLEHNGGHFENSL